MIIRLHVFSGQLLLALVGLHAFSFNSVPQARCRPTLALDMDRRSALTTAGGMLLSQSLLTTLPQEARAEDAVAPITDKVVMDVRISRQDGSFYVRDDLDDKPENNVYYGQLTLGLFGTIAPKTVDLFLSYVNVTFNPSDDNPLPSYARSSFVSLDQGTGLLNGGKIPSLEVTDFGGSTAIKYGGRVFGAPLWVDARQTERISHGTTKGLLTHRTLDVAPTFGITTRTNAELDSTSTVFGQLVLDAKGKEFLSVIEDIPTYSMERPRGDPRQETVMDTVQSSVFNSQKEVFRTVAKSFGDSRLSKVYEGKLMRRVEVTQVKLL